MKDHRDQFGTEIKTYKDYVEQARGRDRIYDLYLSGRYRSRMEGFNGYLAKSRNEENN